MHSFFKKAYLALKRIEAKNEITTHKIYVCHSFLCVLAHFRLPTRDLLDEFRKLSGK